MLIWEVMLIAFASKSWPGLINDYRANNKKSLSMGEAADRTTYLASFFKSTEQSTLRPAIRAYIMRRFDQDASNGSINRELLC